VVTSFATALIVLGLFTLNVFRSYITFALCALFVALADVAAFMTLGPFMTLPTTATLGPFAIMSLATTALFVGRLFGRASFREFPGHRLARFLDSRRDRPLGRGQTKLACEVIPVDGGPLGRRLNWRTRLGRTGFRGRVLRGRRSCLFALTRFWGNLDADVADKFVPI
jgi:hypothetical protein